MRIRTAKKLAERIDLNYFKRAHGLRRWRYILSIAIPAIAVLWIAGLAAAGSRKPYSAGPVSSAHAFAEMKCEVCHTSAKGAVSVRAHVTDKACLTCHDAPAHAANQTRPPDCATCHVEHSGRVQLAKVNDGLCVECHGDLETTNHRAAVASSIGRFPSRHPEFAASRAGVKDPGGVKFNHSVHVRNEGVRGSDGVERLQCTGCHRPEIARTMGRRTISTGLMAPVTYDEACARCHPIYFDELIDSRAPHDTQPVVREFITEVLTRYIALHPREVTKTSAPARRVPLNFPRPVEPPARNAAEWVVRRQAADERLLWNKTCVECHVPYQADLPGPGWRGVPSYEDSKMTRQWMPRASFDHASHLAVRCGDCHAAESSTLTTDVLMPTAAICATCHAPSKGAETRCFECHQYHEWSKAHAVTPAFKLTDFK
jgi:hypothetical protein